MKNYPMKNTDGQPFYVAASDREAITAAMNDAAGEYDTIHTARAGMSSYQDFSDLTPNTSGRPGYTRNVYDAMNFAEKAPQKIKDIIRWTNRVYKRNGLIRNIMDIMGDFGSQGIRISHPDPRVQKFYRNWAMKVGMQERSERFLNLLYRNGNVVIRKQNARISLKQRAQLFKSIAKPEAKFETPNITKTEIPLSYIFLNPSTVEVVGNELACFANVKKYALKLPNTFVQRLNSPNLAAEEKALLASLPKEVQQSLRTGQEYLLPVDKTLVYHYKKDDWEPWAIPMLFALYDDILALEKLKLCDISAMDGATEHLRIIALGDLEHNMIPSRVQISKMKEILAANVGAGTKTVVWGPDIKLIESNVDIHNFLGSKKYEPVLNNIYGGLGIPPTLTGSFTAGGTTNNFVSLKTMVQRLEYGRDILTTFWYHEIYIVQQAMGLPEGAVIEFDFMDLGDSEAEKALLLQMSDRNLISDELLMNRFGHDMDIEESRIRRENSERDSGTRVEKSGQFFETQKDMKMERLAVQKGYVKPEDAGVSLKEIGERMRDKTRPEPVAKTPAGKAGRPKNAKDSTKRKTKTFKPKTKASVEIWANAAQNAIADVLNPAILKSYGKENMRKMTDAEIRTADKIKFGVLFSMEAFSPLTKENVLAAYKEAENLDADVYQSYKQLYRATSADLHRSLTTDEMRHIQTYLYSEVFNEDND